MQKKLIALALASLAGSAFAQSNVTIYGVADATFDNVRAKGATAGSAFNYESRNRVTANSSYIGFKGVEDLGNGLKAVFQFENGVQFDNAAGTWASRDSFVGVAGGFGTIVAGNLTGPTRALGAKLDINSGATGIGANTALLGKLGGGSGAGAFDTRISNAIAYVSPNFAGFNGVVAYSQAGKEAQGPGPVAAGTSTAAYTAGANYENGPVYAGYAYTTVRLQGSDNDLSNHRLGGIFKFGPGQVGALFDQSRLQLVGGDAKQNVWYVNGKFNLGAGALLAQYGRANDVKNVAGDQSATHWTVGYEHSLSKRTILKAVYSQINNDNAAAYDFLYGVSAPNTAALGAGFAGSAGANPRGFSVGVRHSF